MRNSILFLGIAAIIIWAEKAIGQDWSNDTPIFAVLKDLGEPDPGHLIPELNAGLISKGEELVKLGRTTGPEGKLTPYISKFYACTSCHNLEREDPDLTVVDQQARLQYAVKNDLGYLQGSTFWGIVNRETWYNDDYVLKYGDLVKKAEKSLQESIQLCAQVCSQGRPVSDWEMNSILNYLWSLQMVMGDLSITKEELKGYDQLTNNEKIKLIKSKYMQKSPATFSNPPEDYKMGYGLLGDAESGKAIFEQGCQHCHRPNGESDVIFENNELTLNWLKKHLFDKGDKSIYYIIRKGTYAEYGHKEYMPHYTQEKMSDQQIEDLRAYIEKSPAVK